MDNLTMIEKVKFVIAVLENKGNPPSKRMEWAIEDLQALLALAESEGENA